MRFSGRVKTWNADRGFGFIEPEGGGEDIFLHASDVPTQFRPPRIGQPFSFEVQLGSRGKKRAANVGVIQQSRRPVVGPRPEPPATWSFMAGAAIPAFIALYVFVAYKYAVSTWFVAGYVALSCICFLAYAIDKSHARAGRWRTSERSLLALGLAGGWPGGLVAQQLLRHKSSKAAFRQAFWFTVFVNAAAFVGYHAWFRRVAWP